MSSRLKYLIAFFLLAGFVFNFAHSELDFLTTENDIAHEAHDYCQLVNAASEKDIDSSHSHALKNYHTEFIFFSIIPESPTDFNSLLKHCITFSPGESDLSSTPLFIRERILLI
ncbi:MAG: hypothetical protein Q8933_11030 [Bacteroidota bacterium]|nr:hypothetical protein [Bacteroidota bacterium]MDP4195570.1 hypothetical protein [Bacteroidota bacterium]